MEQLPEEECPCIGDDEQGQLSRREERFRRHCISCPQLMKDLRCGSKDPFDPFPAVIEDLLVLRAQVREQNRQNESRHRDLRLLHEFSLVLQTSVDMDEIIAMALTAITAGKGFGLNRAILLLVDKEEQNLVGYFAVGPSTDEEAGAIWKEIEENDYSLREMARISFERNMSAEKEKFRDLLEKLSTPLHRSDHLFVRTLNEQCSRHIENLRLESSIDSAQAKALKVGEMVLVPLISKNRRIGLLLADNIINDRPITDDDLHSLETFTLPVSFAIERTALHERLHDELVKLTEANRRLEEQQELILRMEKMALAGKIASDIAHSIRNPLTIIGGFARALNKGIPKEDGNRKYTESILRESLRLEEILQESLEYSEALHPSFDLWDLNGMLGDLHRELQGHLEKCGATCRLDFSPELPRVRLDYKKITYCLRTLARHGLQSLPAGGEMTMRTAREGGEILVVLSFANPGALPLPNPCARHESGSDLGITLCARILEGHGAELEITKGAEAGTTFTIWMKIAKEDAP